MDLKLEEKIVELYKQGHTYKYIHDLLGVSKKTISRCAKLHGAALRGIGKYDRIDKKIIDNILLEFNTGITIKDISNRTNISTYIITKILKNNNCQLKGSGKHKYLTEQNIADILSSFDDGMSITKIAKIFNCNVKLITKIVKSNRETYTGKACGTRHGHWKGGKHIDNHDYILVRLYPNDQYFSMANIGCYVLEHRYIMAQHLGRCLEKSETVHHIDGNRQNNSIDNLQLRNKAHGKGQCLVCLDCGSKNIQSTEL